MQQCLQFKNDGTCKEITCDSSRYTKMIIIPKTERLGYHTDLIRYLFAELKMITDNEQYRLQNLPVPVPDQDAIDAKLRKLYNTVTMKHSAAALEKYGIRVVTDLMDTDPDRKVFIDIESRTDPGDVKVSASDTGDDGVRYIKSTKGLYNTNTKRQQYKYYIDNEQEAEDVIAHLTSYYAWLKSGIHMANATAQAAMLTAARLGGSTSTEKRNPRTRSPERKRVSEFY